ncbi:hypothetical protein TKK_0016502 [Trichogramma kaykai]|uniref:RNA-directed DNA polymerase n=1 Tax=Trichogramma kaykai TaxID=54128 RepID=A0ABD2W5U1_9HYME
MREGKILDRIFEESHTASCANTLETALKKGTSLMLSSTVAPAEVNKVFRSNNKGHSSKTAVDSKKQSKSESTHGEQQHQQQNKKTCNACGDTNHDFKSCKYKKYKCKICCKVGHLAKMCKSNSKASANTSSVVENSTSSEELSYLSIYNVNCSGTRDELFELTVIVGSDIQFPMEVDSGAEVSVVPYDAYKKFLNTIELKPSKRLIKYFDNTSPKIIGEINTEITYKNKTVLHNLVVTEQNNGKSLFGRDLMKIFGMYIAGIDSVCETPNDVQSMIDKYATLFDGKLGKFTGCKVSLTIKPGSAPIYRKPHTTPFAFKSKVEKELQLLEEQGIIEKVDTSNWGTPLVPVLKPDGNIRVCASYNLTVNKYLDEYHYPIPRIEEIFAALEGGEQFPVLDLARRYNQLEVDEKTKMLLAWSTHKDHKPLLAILSADKGIPQMAAGRMQRWAYFLNGFDYPLEYVKGELNGGADGLSRLPLNVNSVMQQSEFDYFNFLIEDKLPVDAKSIRKETRNDLILSQVFDYVTHGWPNQVDKKLQPYLTRSHELHIENGLFLWGYRFIIPVKFNEDLLKEIHVTHMESSKIKSLARQYFWWPKLDSDIEQYSKNYNICNKIACNSNKASLIKFEQCNKVLERIHCDFLGPMYGKMYFIIMDAYSKWPEVYQMNSITSENTLSKLREFCARYGLPKALVSDNGRQLVSSEFENFCNMNKIKRILSAPYHGSTNGAAENAVKSFKSGLKKALLDPANDGVLIETLISRYLFSYRVSPHCFTGETSAKLMFNRELNTRFDLLKKSRTEINCQRQVNNYSGKRQIAFDVDDVVWIRDNKCPSKPTWVKARVMECLGPRNYLCKTLIDNIMHKRHLDQMRKGGTLITSELQEKSDNNYVQPDKMHINIEIQREQNINENIPDIT